MRILIVSNSPWRSDNSFGNSFTNIFEGLFDIEIANIYCKYGKPQTTVASRFFQITEKSLIKNLIKKSPSGQEVFIETEEDEETDDGEQTFNKIKKYKNIPMYWARALIWKICRWKSPELIKFIDDFKPELLFIPVYQSHYIHDINQFILKRYNLPVLEYVSDDVYTLKRFSLSPLFWIDRLMVRPVMKRVFSWSKIIYVISETQRQEYAAIFGDKFKILTKCADFSYEQKKPFKKPEEVLKMVYAGNLSKGRLDILIKLADAVKTMNLACRKFIFDIYTATPIDEKSKKALNGYGVKLHPAVSYEEIQEIQASADVLVHAEAFNKNERLAVHQSFSTKIVDYLASGKLIFAIGADDCSSIDYFIKNECGIVAESFDDIATQLERIYNSRDKFEIYANAAWESGRANHEKTKIKKMLHDDIVCAIESKIK